MTLRRVGGSVVATFPKALLELLNATEGDTVEYTFDDGKLI
ncbi:MAG TPA: antitoxin, partial [Sutterellaceae bacterium]|nr:antitoxin [Sutterellaceae bacterium]